MKLIIDNREKNIIPLFSDIKFETQNLDLGDFQIINSDGKIVIIIERKTQSDLISSIKDGRHREQKLRLVNSNVSNIAYLIEGKNDLKYFRSNDKASEIGSILNTMFRDKLFVIRTLDKEETVLYIKTLLKKFTKNDFKFENKDYSSVIKLKKKDNLTPENCFIAQLSQIPGVSNTIAKCIVEKYPNMSELCKNYNNSEPEICIKLLEPLTFSQNSGKNRKVGKVLSERIYKYLNNIN
jgi:ERCC4-type nuclease